MRAIEKEPATLTATVIAGVPAMKMTRKNETDYWVETGEYVVSSGEISVVEQILKRLKKDAPQSESLAATPEFKEASPLLGSGCFEYFLNISDLAKLANDVPTPAGFRAGTVLDAMKAGSMHSFAGRVVLDGPKTRFQTAVLGDASEGTIFDIWGAGQAKPASIAYIPQDAVSYREFQLNLPGIYALAMRVAKSFLAQGEQDKTDMIESLARAKLGMSTSEALHALTGEAAYLQADSSYDLSKNTFFLGVNDRENTLKLIRHALLDNITADTDLDGVTFFTFSSGGARAPSGSGNNNATKYHLAVTDDMILVSANQTSLRAQLAKKKSPAPPSQLASFFAARTGGPAAVNGLSFVDFQKFDWQSLKNYVPRHNTATGASVLLGLMPDKTAPSQGKSWLEEIDPKAFSRHLHLSYGYSWKDANGIHLEGWID